MPTSGPVYQPTTVSYEQQNGAWMRPGAFISHSLGSRIRSPRFLQWILLILMIVCFIVGLSMIIDGSLVYSKTQDSMSESDGGGGSTIIVVGVLLIVIGLIFTGFFIKLMRRRRACPCFPNKEERLARQLDSQGGNGQILTQNPSTDLLVTAQYAPVSEIAYQPPSVAAADHEETSKLMPSDLIKDWLRAPLATLDDLTPSLRSSASSLFYQRSVSSFYPSDSSSDTVPLSADQSEVPTSPAPPYNYSSI